MEALKKVMRMANPKQGRTCKLTLSASNTVLEYESRELVAWCAFYLCRMLEARLHDLKSTQVVEA